MKPPSLIIRAAVAQEAAYVGPPARGLLPGIARAARCLRAAIRCARLERGPVARPCVHCGGASVGEGPAGWARLEEAERLGVPCIRCGMRPGQEVQS